MTVLAMPRMLGFPKAVAATIRLETANDVQGLVSIGYDRGGKRHVTAQALLPTLADAKALLADRDRLAALVAQGVWAMPAAFRPELPEWIQGSALARQAEAMRTRATAIAATAATTVEAQDLPWAA